MPDCWFCERDFKPEEMTRKQIYDNVLQQTIMADVCEECSDCNDLGLFQDPNNDLN